MSTDYGYALTLLFVGLIISGFVSLHFLAKHKRSRTLVFIALALIPTLYLFTIRDRLDFGLNYLPSQSSDDLTYSSFHIGAILLTTIATIYMIIQAQKDKRSTESYFFGRLSVVDFRVFLFGLLLFGIEVYKQLIFLNLAEGIAAYSWYGFPLQFCSIPLFFYPLVPFLKDGKIKQALYSFIALFTFLGGFLVVVVGGSVFTVNVAISVHTMIWHGSMVIVGLYVLVARDVVFKWRLLRGAIIVLAILVVFVQGVNSLFHYIGNDSFDGFFISPWQSTMNMPVLSDIRVSLQATNMPIILVGIIFSLIYFIAFAIGGSVIFTIARLLFTKEVAATRKKEAELVLNY